MIYAYGILRKNGYYIMHKRSACISYGKAVYHIAKRYIIEKYLHIPQNAPLISTSKYRAFCTVFFCGVGCLTQKGNNRIKRRRTQTKKHPKRECFLWFQHFLFLWRGIAVRTMNRGELRVLPTCCFADCIPLCDGSGVCDALKLCATIERPQSYACHACAD